MKDLPILFRGDMVRAILREENPKRMTRRICDMKYWWGQPDSIFPDGSGKGFIAWWGSESMTAEKTALLYPGDEGFRCPYGQPGDLLWVRERHSLSLRGEDDNGFTRLIKYRADNSVSVVPGDAFAWFDKTEGRRGYRDLPSIHLPRWASRISLENTGVKVERLQDISEEDAIAEGAHWLNLGKDQWGNDLPGWSMLHPHPADHRQCLGTARMAFANYICVITDGPRWNMKPETVWDRNPWVWAISFKREV